MIFTKEQKQDIRRNSQHNPNHEFIINGIEYKVTYKGVGFIFIKEKGKGNKKEIKINFEK